MKVLMTVVFAAVLAFVGVLPASAAQMTGAYSISGNFNWVDNTTGGTVPVGVSNAADFELTTNTPTPGVPGSFFVNNANGSFAAIAGLNTGAIKDFTFTSAPGNTNYPNLPVLAFETIGDFTFDLMSLSNISPNLFGSLDLVGDGVFHSLSNAFDATNGHFVFSGQTAGGGSFSFSASQSTVPEPATLLLLGTGLVAAGVFTRKRR